MSSCDAAIYFSTQDGSISLRAFAAGRILVPMLAIHATRKLLTALKREPLSNVVADQSRLGTWYADLNMTARRRVVVLLNEKTLLTLAMPLKEFAADPVNSVRSSLAGVLHEINVPDDVIAREISLITDAVFTKTQSRVMLALMRQAMDVAAGYIANKEPLEQFNRTMTTYLYGRRSSPNAFDLPVDLVSEVLGVPTSKPKGVDFGSYLKTHDSPHETLLEIARVLKVALSPTAMRPTMPTKKSRTMAATPASSKSKGKVRALVFRVSLDHINPEIWREIRVPETATLRHLHEVIQIAMGWLDCHLHSFEIGPRSYGNPSMFDDFDELINERQTKISSLDLKKGKQITYIYDIGNYWKHTISVQKEVVVAHDESFAVIDGARACPPEDSGGPWGYQRFCEIMSNPRRREHKVTAESYNKPFEPEKFDLKVVQAKLKEWQFSTK